MDDDPNRRHPHGLPDAAWAVALALVLGLGLTALFSVAHAIAVLHTGRWVENLYPLGPAVASLLALHCAQSLFIDVVNRRLIVFYELCFALSSAPLLLRGGSSWALTVVGAFAGSEYYRFAVAHDIGAHPVIESDAGVTRHVFYTSGIMRQVLKLLLPVMFVAGSCWGLLQGILWSAIVLPIMAWITFRCLQMLGARRRWLIVDDAGLTLRDHLIPWEAIQSVRRTRAGLRVDVDEQTYRQWRSSTDRELDIFGRSLMRLSDALDARIRKLLGDQVQRYVPITDYYRAAGQLRQAENLIARFRPDLSTARRR